MFRRGSIETAERNAEKGIYGGDPQTVGPFTLRRWVSYMGRQGIKGDQIILDQVWNHDVH